MYFCVVRSRKIILLITYVSNMKFNSRCSLLINTEVNTIKCIVHAKSKKPQLVDTLIKMQRHFNPLVDKDKAKINKCLLLIKMQNVQNLKLIYKRLP